MMLGADPRQLGLMKPRWPLEAFTVHEFGAFGARRFRPDQGACGVHGFPCTHWGVDMSAPPGSVVRVPFNGFVLYHGPADKPPFVGYGPWVALIAHADTETPLHKRVWQWATGPLVDIFDLPEGAVSVRYSLLAHMADPTKGHGEVTFPVVKPEQTIKPFSLVGDIFDAAKTKPNPDRWRPMKARPSTVVMYTDADGRTSDRLVFAGQKIGEVAESAHPHVHWELRTAPIAPAGSGNWRINPLDVFSQAYGLALPSGVPQPAAVPTAARGGGGAGILLLLAALAFGKKKKHASR